MAQTGLAALALSALAALAGLVLGLSRPGASRSLRAIQILTVAACGLAFAALTLLVARGDETVAYALEHRAPAGAPAGYRIAAVWAGQAGGLLLWALETALIALALRPSRHPRAAAALFAIQSCLLGLTLAGNPFRAATSADAAGLNPLLQHPMMLIHPPMLFLGYALLAVPYAITLGALADRAREGWAATVRPWLLVSWLALTAGNGFGAEWAYKTFGWGGFWAWDPVENTSFVPWTLSAVAIHCLWLASQGARALRAAAACALGAFVTVLYGSFLARSGVLSGASVHAYVSGERLMQWALGALLAGASAAAVAALIVRWRHWENAAPEAAPKLAATGWGAGTMAAIAILVLAGMSLPMLGQAPQTVAYNTFLMPFGVAMLALLGLSLVRAPRVPRWVAPLTCGVTAALVGLGLMISLTADVPDGYARIGACIFAPLMVVAAATVASLSLRDLFAPGRPRLCSEVGDGGAHSTIPWSRGAAAECGGAPRAVCADARGPVPCDQETLCPSREGERASRVFLSATTLVRRGHALAHLGVALLLGGAVISGYGVHSEQVFLQPGVAQTAVRHSLTLTQVRAQSRELTRADLTVDGRPAAVEVERNAAFNSDLRRAYIRRGLGLDVYVTPLALVPEPMDWEGQRIPVGAMVQVSAKPLMSLVWAGMILIAVGLGLSIARRRASSPSPAADGHRDA